MMRGIVTLAILFLFVAQSWANENGLTLKVRVEGGEPDTGQIIATLFNSEETYMKEPLSDLTIPIDGRGEGVVIFNDLSSGDYALSIIYDKNANGELDTGFLGIPKEKIGFSNNAKPRMGPAPYDKAKFELTPLHTEISITLGGAKRK